MKFDCANLKRWFLAEKRDLPWRVNRSPYAVWVSEMMLQQTQVSVVIPYFERWMKRFPTLKDLAAAELDEVIKLWEGLGYYSRARFLHQGARQIVEKYDGVFPDSEDALKQIKGLGPYTAGAVLSFAFHKRVAAVDGNVMRVLARYFCIQEDISKPKIIQNIRKIALDLLPEHESWIVNEALIELGATVCTRTPNCGQCPLRKSCQGYAHGKATELPIKSAKTQIVPLYRAVAVIRWNDYLLVQRGQQGAIMSDLHEFPYFETSEEGFDEQYLHQKVLDTFGCKVKMIGMLPEVRHSFTRYRVRLHSTHFLCVNRSLPIVKAPFKWVAKSDLAGLAFSSGHKRVLQSLD